MREQSKEKELETIRASGEKLEFTGKSPTNDSQKSPLNTTIAKNRLNFNQTSSIRFEGLVVKPNADLSGTIERAKTAINIKMFNRLKHLKTPKNLISYAFN